MKKIFILFCLTCSCFVNCQNTESPVRYKNADIPRRRIGGTAVPVAVMPAQGRSNVVCAANVEKEKLP